MAKVTLKQLETIYKYTDGDHDRNDVSIIIVHAEPEQVYDLLGFIHFCEDKKQDEGFIRCNLGHDLGILRRQIQEEEDDGSSPRTNGYYKYLPSNKIKVTFTIKVPYGTVDDDSDLALDDPTDFASWLLMVLESEEVLQSGTCEISEIKAEQDES